MRVDSDEYDLHTYMTYDNELDALVSLRGIVGWNNENQPIWIEDLLRHLRISGYTVHMGQL